MARRQWHYHYVASPTFYFPGTNDRFFRIVAALDDHIWLEVPDQIEGGVLGKNYHQIHAFERSEHIRSLGISPHRPCGSFEPAHRLIAIEPDDESVGGFARGEKNVDVAGMKQIEDTVRERDPPLSSRSPPLSLHPCCNLGRGISSLQSLLVAEGWK